MSSQVVAADVPEQQKHELEFWRQLKYGKDYKDKTELFEPTRRVDGKTSPLVTT